MRVMMVMTMMMVINMTTTKFVLHQIQVPNLRFLPFFRNLCDSTIAIVFHN